MPNFNPKSPLCAALLLLAATSVAGAQVAPAGTPGSRVINEADRVVLAGNVPARAKAQFDIGRSDSSLPMQRIILQLNLRSGAKADLDQLLRAQQDPASPQYHKWLTPDEFGARFGATDADLQTLTNWLTGQGFTIDEVAHGRGWINVSGTAAQVEKAFATEMHDYRIDGKVYHANSLNPSIPRGLADLLGGPVSLHNFQRKSHLHVKDMAALLAGKAAQPRAFVGGVNVVAPADFATIYDLNQAYNAGVNGSGQSIAIVARTDIHLSDVRSFRSTYGLPANDPVFVHNGTPPGVLCSSDPNEGCDELESDVDTEWAGAVAPQATVKLVISATTNTSDGVELSAQYIVDNTVAPVASTSYGLCEAEAGVADLMFYDGLLAQGAAEGISSFAASGDFGAGDCTNTGKAVDNPCSSPNNTCVGGTQFNDTSNPSQYWLSTPNSTTKESARSYIPEVAWNEFSIPVSEGGPGGSSGGGTSTFFAKPSWQVAAGVPADGKRDVPDVALNSALHDGNAVWWEGQDVSGEVYGTSFAAPSFAGLTALLVQKTGSAIGNANPLLYQLGAAQYAGTGPAVFHDIKSGNNSGEGTSGFTAGVGYDRVTGLGSVDFQALLTNWPGTSGGGTGTPQPCVPSSTNLCLFGGRFGVSATFNAGASGSGNAQVVDLTDDTGYLWFFDASNVEVVAKVLNGCGLGGNYWFFAGGLTNVNVVITVTDSTTGNFRTYTNAQNTPFQPLQDTAAFPTCP